jgi:bifunctional lysine-specific demethylase and histidyl-hydroxylase NO66
VAAPGWLSFVKDVVRPPSREQMTRDGTLDVAAIHRAVADKQSLLLTKVHRLHRPTGLLCRQITADFRSAGIVLRKPIRANAYFTPPRSQGFAPHYDDHDVLVLQLSGDKLWRIHGEAANWPRKPMLDALPPGALNPKPQEVILRAGDVFYLPRGFVHEALAQDSASLHLTLSVQAATWSDVFERLIELEDRLGEPLPVGFCAGGIAQASDRARVGEIGAGMGRWPEVGRAIADIYNSTFSEGDLPPNGLLAQRVADFEISPDTWLVAADGVSANLEFDGDTAILRLGGAALRAEKRAAPLFKNISSGQRFRLRDLGSAADAMALADLVQELVRRGVAVIVSATDEDPFIRPA